MSEDLRLTIPPDLATLLREAVAAGEFPSVDAALADALETWGRRHEERAENLAWLKARLLSARLDPRPLLSQAEVDDKLKAFFAAAEKAADEAA